MCSEFEAIPFYWDPASKDKNKLTQKHYKNTYELGRRTKLEPSKNNPVSATNTPESKFSHAVESMGSKSRGFTWIHILCALKLDELAQGKCKAPCRFSRERSRTFHLLLHNAPLWTVYNLIQQRPDCSRTQQLSPLKLPAAPYCRAGSRSFCFDLFKWN